MTIANRRNSGFTLIEISVVLFIASLFLGGIIAMVNSLLMNQRISATQTKEDAIKAALTNFIIRKSRLPCPAVATLSESIPADIPKEGVEATSGTCAETTISGTSPNQVAIGVIPWVTLGLSRESGLDAYANRFTYQVTVSATGLTSYTVSGMAGKMTVHSAGLGVLGAAPTGNQTNDSVVAAIISHGKDGYGAYTRSGIQIPFDAAVTGFDAKENANADGKVVVKDFSDVASNPFDDIVLTLTTSDLLTPLILSGTMKDYMATLNATIDIIKYNVIASAYTAGGITPGPPPVRYYSFPSSFDFTTVPPANRNDPWGNAIIYARTTQDIRCSTPSSNAGVPVVAFTLTSGGPDGPASSADDIRYTTYVSDIQAIIAKAGCNN